MKKTKINSSYIPVKNIKLSVKEKKIDKILEKQIFDDYAWETAIKVTPKVSMISMRMDSKIIEKARALAKIHKEKGYQTWLKKIIKERIEFEESIIKTFKKKAA